MPASRRVRLSCLAAVALASAAVHVHFASLRGESVARWLACGPVTLLACAAAARIVVQTALHRTMQRERTVSEIGAVLDLHGRGGEGGGGGSEAIVDTARIEIEWSQGGLRERSCLPLGACSP